MAALQDADNLSELQSQNTQSASEALCDAADGTSDGKLHFGSAGHGTHVAGLLVANGAANPSTKGSCDGCGLAFAKASRLRCNFSISSPRVLLEMRFSDSASGLGHLVAAGSQVTSMSFGIAEKPGVAVPNCNLSEPGPPDEDPFCLELRSAKLRDVVTVAASGNARASALNFPARDPRVIAAGGVDAAAPDALWDFSPSSDLLSCPLSNPSNGNVTAEECGSNYSEYSFGDPARREEFRQEFVAPAVAIHSTFHPGKTWHNQLQCGDSFGPGTGDDGFGQCTGTSMSAPMIAGIAGLLRSINPLLPAGDPFDGAAALPGVRDVMADTSQRTQSGLSWSSRMGFGLPDAGAAASRVLGKVSGARVRTRLTPVFRLYSSGESDYAATTNPQLAMSLMTVQANNYASTSPDASGVAFLPGVAVRGYGSFPDGSGAPRAFAFLLSTSASVHGVAPVPVFLLDRCNKALQPACSGQRDFLLLTKTADVEWALANGYEYLGAQGYIFPTCPGDTCKPPNTETMYLRCSAPRNDCAVVMESELAGFAASGNGAYAEALHQSTQALGYAYPPTHSDGDDLPDGFESVIGTSPIHSDSDGDGTSDSTEFQLAGISTSDPCLGAGPSACPFVFRNGFEAK